MQGQAARLHLDPTRIVLVGDTAGAQISGRVAALITNRGYAEELDIAVSIDPGQLRGVALCCGIFDIAAINDSGPFKNVLNAVGWAYSGTRHYRANNSFTSTISVPERVTDQFSPTFVTAGNADPLLPQSLALVATLTVNWVSMWIPSSTTRTICPRSSRIPIRPRHRRPAGGVRPADRVLPQVFRWGT